MSQKKIAQNQSNQHTYSISNYVKMLCKNISNKEGHILTLFNAGFIFAHCVSWVIAEEFKIQLI